jgi:hypothetical protein
VADLLDEAEQVVWREAWLAEVQSSPMVQDVDLPPSGRAATRLSRRTVAGGEEATGESSGASNSRRHHRLRQGNEGDRRESRE